MKYKSDKQFATVLYTRPNEAYVVFGEYKSCYPRLTHVNNEYRRGGGGEESRERRNISNNNSVN